MKKTISMLAILLLTIGIVSAYSGSTVTRTLPTTASLEPFKVTLDVDINEGETYYAIDERVPDGWEILSASDDGFIKGNSIKWCLIQGAVDVTYEYEVVAETGLGLYEWGIFMFEGDEERRYIEGDSKVLVCETGADSDGDGKIDMGEIMDYTSEWSAGNIEIVDFMKAVKYWGAGVGC